MCLVQLRLFLWLTNLHISLHHQFHQLFNIESHHALLATLPVLPWNWMQLYIMMSKSPTLIPPHGIIFFSPSNPLPMVALSLMWSWFILLKNRTTMNTHWKVMEATMPPLSQFSARFILAEWMYRMMSHKLFSPSTTSPLPALSASPMRPNKEPMTVEKLQ